MSNVFMSEIGLDRSQVRTTLCQVVPAGVAKHVRMHVQGTEARALRDPVDHQARPSSCNRSAPLRDEDEIPSLPAFSFEASQCPDLPAAQVVITRIAVLRAVDMENPLVKVELVPFRLQTLFYAQSVGEQDEDQCRIAMAVAVFPSGQNQLFDFGFEQVFPLSLPAARARPGNCSPNSNRHHVSHIENPQYLHRVAPRHCTEKAQKGNSFRLRNKHRNRGSGKRKVLRGSRSPILNEQ